MPCQATRFFHISRRSLPDGLSHALAFPQADNTDMASSSPWPLLMGALVGCLGFFVVALSWSGSSASKTGSDKVDGQKRSCTSVLLRTLRFFYFVAMKDEVCYGCGSKLSTKQPVRARCAYPTQLSHLTAPPPSRLALFRTRSSRPRRPQLPAPAPALALAGPAGPTCFASSASLRCSGSVPHSPSTRTTAPPCEL